MRPKRTTKANFAERAALFTAHVVENPDALAFAMFDRMLDSLLGEDYFGTEGQSDPRGDRR